MRREFTIEELLAISLRKGWMASSDKRSLYLYQGDATITAIVQDNGVAYVNGGYSIEVTNGIAKDSGNLNLPIYYNWKNLDYAAAAAESVVLNAYENRLKLRGRSVYSAIPTTVMPAAEGRMIEI